MDGEQTTPFWQRLWRELHPSSPALPPLIVTGHQALISAYPVSELAAASIALAAQSAGDLVNNHSPLHIDSVLASRWFQHALRPINRPPAALWDPFAGDYASGDGWVRLHTNALHHREAMERVLGRHASRQALAASVAKWQARDLEDAVVQAGGCAAALRSQQEWQQHPQGQCVASEALIEQSPQPDGPAPRWRLSPARPLYGVRVLDLTRVIAGPVATRFLAGLGADVLRIDPPDWQEPSLEEDVTLGKRCARLDLKSQEGRRQFEALLRHSDVLVHGYRADALSRLGYDLATRQAISPGLVDVSLNAWGWSGPWRNRRGFDSLVQMACGIAETGRQWRGEDAPVPLPVQALDHATGYLMAAAVLKGLRQRQRDNRGFSARLSLARTACLLTEQPPLLAARQTGLTPRQWQDEELEMVLSSWGIAAQLRAPFHLAGTPLLWSRAPAPLGSATAEWLLRPH